MLLFLIPMRELLTLQSGQWLEAWAPAAGTPDALTHGRPPAEAADADGFGLTATWGKVENMSRSCIF